jgi:O-succinylbenzoic acid--CoA ligase
MTGLRRLAIPSGDAVLSVLGDVAKALDGGEPLRPVAPRAEAAEAEEWATQDLPDNLAVVVGTSGSTGIAKVAMLTADNLMSSATATHDILGGPGRWLLALPAHHIAGLQVLVRSILAGTSPCTLDLDRGFTAPAFVTATQELHSSGAPRAYTALVPTQLSRLLDDPAGAEALASYDGVLVGGAALNAAERSRARAAGVHVVSTYGMSETAGGCVYDGTPLAVTEVHIDNDHHVVIGGATVALGYLRQPLLTRDVFAVDADGVRWFRTDDLGVLDEDGRLQVRGRADDLINTGAFKVAPGPVEDAVVRFVPGVVDAVVVGTPHPTWGEAVSLTVVMRRGAPKPTVRDVRTALRGILPDHALPQRLLVLDAFPLRGPGKPDRRALAAAFGETLMAQEGS